MGPKTATDVQGFEYDWLAVDAVGHVALFTTGGGGFAPSAFLKDTEAHDRAITDLLAIPANTTAVLAPVLPPELENTWRLVAERGLYAFDCDLNGGPYRLRAAPLKPVQIGSLPQDVASVAIGVTLPGLNFAERDLISGDLIEGGGNQD